MIGIITFMAAAEAADKSNKALKEIQKQEQESKASTVYDTVAKCKVTYLPEACDQYCLKRQTKDDMTSIQNTCLGSTQYVVTEYPGGRGGILHYVSKEEAYNIAHPPVWIQILPLFFIVGVCIVGVLTYKLFTQQGRGKR